MQQMTRLLTIMAQLRDKENGCPWDVEQTFASIASCTIEEAYEVTDAIAQNDMDALKEELGDLLLQVVFHGQMAKEEGLFDFEEIAKTISEKLIARHPHVFGDAEVRDAQAQEEAWEALKEKERQTKGLTQQSLLDGITQGLPGLMRAVKLQKRAAKAGFDWEKPEDIFDKLEEETQELKEAMAEGADNMRLQDELGDMLFVCTNLARRLNIDPEEALRGTNRKFEQRFRSMESQARQASKPLSSYPLDELEQLWQRAKKTA